MSRAQFCISIVTFMALLISNWQYIAFLLSLSALPASVIVNQFQDSISHMLSLLSVDITAVAFYMWTLGGQPDARSMFTFFASITLLQLVGILLPAWGEKWAEGFWLPIFFLSLFPYLFVFALINFTALFIQKHPRGNRSWLIASAALITISMVIFVAWVVNGHFPKLGDLLCL